MITPHPARLVLAALASGAFFATPATGTEYHVSPTGADGNDGSSGAMFKTLSKAAEIAQAGDVITVHAGIYWPVKLSLADAAQVQNLGEHTRPRVCSPWMLRHLPSRHRGLAIGGRRMRGALVICSFFSLMDNEWGQSTRINTSSISFMPFICLSSDLPLETDRPSI